MSIVGKLEELIEDGRYTEVRRPAYPVPFDFFTAMDGPGDSGADKEDGEGTKDITNRKPKEGV